MIVQGNNLVYNIHKSKEPILNDKEEHIMNIDESILSTLTDEQKKKVEAAQSPEELLSLAREAGYELAPDQLEAVAGGDTWHCGKDNCKKLLG